MSIFLTLFYTLFFFFSLLPYFIYLTLVIDLNVCPVELYAISVINNDLPAPSATPFRPLPIRLND